MVKINNMKRKIIICIFFIILLDNQIGAEEINFLEYNENIPQDYLYNKHTLMEMSLRLFLSPSPTMNFSFLNIGGGWNYDIIKNIISPGILFDVSIGTDWLWLFSEDKDENDDKERNQFGLGAGARIYNMIEIYEFRIIPFIGCNFLLFYKVSPMFGLSLSFKYFGIEYAYYFPLGNYKPEADHHISIKIIIKDF